MKTITFPVRTFAATLLLLAATGAPAQPERIVSLSLCSDQLVQLLADDNRIASLSYLARDPANSWLADDARAMNDVHFNRGQAEEILPLDPDLILTSRFSAEMAVRLLENLDYEVTRLDFPATLDETYTQIRRVAQLLGETARGQALIAEIESSVNAAREDIAAFTEAPLGLFYANNGFTFGAGTLRHAFLESLGIRNLAAETGIAGIRKISLERVIAARPDYLFVNRRQQQSSQLANAVLHHPAIARTFSDHQIVAIPDLLFQCAGPSLARAYDRLAAELGVADE